MTKMRGHSAQTAAGMDAAVASSSSFSVPTAKATQLRPSAGPPPATPADGAGSEGGESTEDSPRGSAGCLWNPPTPPQQWRYLNWLKLGVALTLVGLVVYGFSNVDTARLEELYK